MLPYKSPFVWQIKFYCINDGETYIVRVNPEYITDGHSNSAARQYAKEYIKHSRKDLQIKEITQEAPGTQPAPPITRQHPENWSARERERLN